MVNRKVAIIVAWLVPEAREKGNEEIAKEIREELDFFGIPYAEKIEKVTVLSEGEMPKEALKVIIKRDEG